MKFDDKRRLIYKRHPRLSHARRRAAKWVPNLRQNGQRLSGPNTNERRVGARGCSPSKRQTTVNARKERSHELDEMRRARLKSFLVGCRSRLRPGDVGLPATLRRRVAGLRREEIAELVGVSSDWYRWFESGRPIRVSVQFVAKVSHVLRLSPLEQICLYHLALPEIYEAYASQCHITIPCLAVEAR